MALHSAEKLPGVPARCSPCAGPLAVLEPASGWQAGRLWRCPPSASVSCHGAEPG